MTASPYWFNELASAYPGIDPNTEWLGDPAAAAAGALGMDFGAGMDMGAAPGAAGVPGTDMLKQMASRTLPGSFGVQRFMGKGIGAESIPGPFVQVPPRSNVGLGAGNDVGVPTPLNQTAMLRPVTVPTGHEWPAGSPVKSNYSNLNGLRNRAYGVNYGQFS